jgi:hypothetical protein
VLGRLLHARLPWHRPNPSAPDDAFRVKLLKALRPGDVLLYRPCSLFGYLICIKTFSDVSHCEVYLGDGKSGASRDGIGVNTYDLRVAQLACVLRPFRYFKRAEAVQWHNTVVGEKYDWLGLLGFVNVDWLVGHRRFVEWKRDRMFCSVYVTRMMRAGGIDLFGRAWDADKTAPGTLKASPVLYPVPAGGSDS